MYQKTVIEAAVEDFRRSVEITRDVRFQANLRLAKRQRLSSYVVSFLSLYVISLSLLPNIISLDPTKSQILLACSIILSVFIIFTSLIDGAQNFHHQGELLHLCARKLAKVHQDLKKLDVNVDPTKAGDILGELQAQYRKALDECPINHDNVDFVRQKAVKPHLFPRDYARSFKIPLMLWYRIYAKIACYSWLFTHVIAVTTISIVVYVFVFKA